MKSRVKSFRGEGQDVERHVVGGVWRAVWMDTTSTADTMSACEARDDAS